MSFDFKYELSEMSPLVDNGAKIYVYGIGHNWEFICKQFKFLVNINIDKYIYGFIDNDPQTQDTVFHGKTVYALEDIDTQNAIILIAKNNWNENKAILNQLLPYGMFNSNSVFCIGWNLHILMRYTYKRLARFKGLHKGKRCFVIGNGPSLSNIDLDKLKGEFTFSSNGIYMMFNKTDWRPSYYVCIDDEILRKAYDDIEKNIKCPAFISQEAIMSLARFNLDNFYFFTHDHRNKLRPERTNDFSEEIAILSNGHNVTYACLQICVYMGFSEIFLLGVDNTFRLGVKLNGELVYGKSDISHFHKNYKNIIADNYATIPIDVINAAYTTARVHCESRGVKIYNATRGGELEIFERIDFDSLF